MKEEEEEEPVEEVLGDDVVGGELNTHRVSVEEDEYPCSVVGHCIPQHLIQSNIIQIKIQYMTIFQSTMHMCIVLYI